MGMAGILFMNIRRKVIMILGVVSIILSGSGAAASTGPTGLTFAERVVYQRAIEEVYWRHRIWPNDRSPKPAFDQVTSDEQIQNKVKEYLQKSESVSDYGLRPITSEQLQTEMDRMAQHSRQPEVLRELFAALGNDPVVIAECLARPVLANRLASD